MPANWTAATLSDITDVVRGITFPATAKESSLTQANVCCLRTSNIQRKIEWDNVYFIPRNYVKREDQLVQPGDILMSMANSYELVGKVAVANIVPYPTAFGAFLAAIRPTSIVDGKYLFHLLRTNKVQSKLREGSSQTTNIANISISKLASIDIPLAPTSEQKRIADKLDAVLARVDTCRDRLDRIPAILKRFRQSVLAAATSGKLTEDWRGICGTRISPNEVIAERYSFARKDSERKALESFFAEYTPVSGDGHGLPSTWVFTNIGSIGVVSNGSTPSRKVSTYWDGDIAWVSSGEVRNTVISSTRERITSEGYENSSVRMLPKGAVLLAMIGEGKTRGQSALLNLMACINQNIAGVVPIESLISSKYLWYWFQGQYENNRLVGSGTGPQALNCQRVRELPVNLPPVEEQTEIVRRIEALFAFADRLEARYTAARAQVEKLTPSTLAKAFRGELVPQDPNDEPASVLLQRIHAQRNDKPKARK